MLPYGIRLTVNLSGQEYLRVPRFESISIRHRPFTSLSVVLKDTDGKIQTDVSEGDPIRVKTHYKSQDPISIKGIVRNVETQLPDQVRVTFRLESEVPLFTTKIKESFMTDSPETIIQFGLNAAGIEIENLEKSGVKFPRFIASNISVWEVAKRCEATMRSAFGIDTSGICLWLDSENKACWGDFEDKKKEHTFSHGQEVINSSISNKPGKLNWVEIPFDPALKHSISFNVVVPKRALSGPYRALKVKSIVTPEHARTFLYWGVENGGA